jgi:hypothetical protein
MRSIAKVLAFNSISQTNMTKAVQIQTVYGLFHRNADDGVMGETEKFIKGIGPYAKMVLWEADNTNDSTIRHVIPELLYRQRGKVLVRGDNITTTLICRIYESKEDMCVGTLPKGYIRNVPLPRVPRGQSAKSRIQVTTIPDYHATPYVVPTYVSPRSLVESAAYALSPAWHAIAIDT